MISWSVTTAWRVQCLRMEKRPLVWSIAANILNKQSRTADKEWSCSLGIGRVANNASPYKLALLWNGYLDFGPGLILSYDVRRGGKHLSEIFLIKNGLKQEDALSPLFFNSALQYTIRRVQVNRNGLKLNGTQW
jgi:hypothetical protein